MLDSAAAHPGITFIRLLTREDAAEYHVLRLKSLHSAPEAFLSDYKTEAQYHTEVYANHLDWAYHPPYLGYYGIFVKGVLAGYVQISKSMLEKQDHIVFINNLYIDGQYRHQGLASQLLNHVFGLLRQANVAERALVSCTAKNKAACKFYVKNGFRRFAVQAKVVKWQGHYDDAIEFVKVL